MHAVTRLVPLTSIIDPTVCHRHHLVFGEYGIQLTVTLNVYIVLLKNFTLVLTFLWKVKLFQMAGAVMDCSGA